MNKILLFITLLVFVNGCSSTAYMHPLHHYVEIINFVNSELNNKNDINFSQFRLADISYSYSKGYWLLLYVDKEDEFGKDALYIDVDRNKTKVRYKF